MTMQTIAVGRLFSRDNVRAEVGDVSELAASIKSVGLLEPLIATEPNESGDHRVVVGARRLAAARKAGLTEVPVDVRAFTEVELVEVMVIENLQREDLTPLEEADAFQRLIGLGLQQRQVAARVGRSQAHVSKRLALLQLPDSARELVDSGGITLEDAQELGKVKGNTELVEGIVATIQEQQRSKPATGMPAADLHLVAQRSSVVSREVREELLRREREKKLSDACKALATAGEVVVKIDGGQHGYSKVLPEGFALVRPGTYNVDQIDMLVEDHQKLDCHAVGVDPSTFETLEVCSAPATHPDRRQLAADANARREAEAQAAAAAWNEAEAFRVAFLVKLTTGRIDKQATLDVCHEALRHPSGSYYQNGPAQYACGLLALESDVEDDEPVDWLVLLEAQAAKSGAEKLRVTMALALSVLEMQTGPRRQDEGQATYLTLLETLGHTLSDAELLVAGRTAS